MMDRLRCVLRQLAMVMAAISISLALAAPDDDNAAVSLPLAPGWNLLGNGQDVVLEVPAFLGDQTSNVVSLWKWDATAQNWAFYSPLLGEGGSASVAAARGYQVLSSIGPGEGYWINANGPGVLPQITGTRFAFSEPGFAALPSGWNLLAIGPAAPASPSAFSLQMSSSLVAPRGFSSLWQWNAAASKWWFYSPVMEASGGLAAVKEYAESRGYLDFETLYPPGTGMPKRLELGSGFWVNLLPATNYTLSTATSGTGSGSVNADPAGPSYTSGAVVTVTATPGTNSTFAGWSGACTGTSVTCTVTMNANQSVTATFNANPVTTYTLSLATAGTGNGTVTADPAGPSYTSGAVVTVTAAPGAGSTFAGWSGDCTGTAATCTVTMNANLSVTATYDAIPVTTYTLSTATAGSGSGTVSADPAGPSYTSGTVVTLTAASGAGSIFSGWSGACSGVNLTCTVTMNVNQSVTATFTPAPGIPGILLVSASDGLIALLWAPVSGATAYHVYSSTTPGVSKASTRVGTVTDTFFMHFPLTNGTVYYYVVTAQTAAGESDISQEVSATPHVPRISGTATLPPLAVSDGGGVQSVILTDLSYNELARVEGTANFQFTVEADKAYVLTAFFNDGQAIAAVTPPMPPGDITQDINLDTEVAMSLIVATEQAFGTLEPANLSRSLDALRYDANTAVVQLKAFYADRNANRQADRLADAVYALTLDRLNRGSVVSVSDLNPATLRAYGGGLQGLRSLSAMVSSPLAPLNPHFTFTRFNSVGKLEVGMSDLETQRWDYFATDAGYPHIPVGGSRLTYAAPNGAANAGGYALFGIYTRTLGGGSPALLTLPIDNLYCLMPSISPDQSRIAAACAVVNFADINSPGLSTVPFEIYVMNTDGSNRVQVTSDGTGGETLLTNFFWQGNLRPSWSPDGQKVLFYRVIVAYDAFIAAQQIDVVNSDGTGRKTILFGGHPDLGIIPEDPALSPDGKELLFSIANHAFTARNLYSVSLSQDYTPQSLLRRTNGAWIDRSPSYSHDGKHIIFASDRGGETGTSGALLSPLHVMNRYTGAITVNLGNFANAGFYGDPRFTATEAVLTAVEGQPTDSSGTVIISGTDARTTSGMASGNTYYREIIPAGNNIGLDFSVTSWW